MPQHTAREQGTMAYLQEEWGKFNAWAAESRQIMPFIDLAIHWHAGHLTIAEGKRIETDQQLARLLVH